MIIQTPSDLATYLISLATLQREVKHVIYGEHSRVESDTLASSQYPQVDIETPAASIPVDQVQARLSTRLYVISATPSGQIAEEDINHHITFNIARAIINLVIKHADSGYIDIELDATAPIQITPIVAMGSDQQRGWMFKLEFLIDNHLCTDDLDPDALVIPQFSYQVDDDHELTITDLTHGATDPAAELTWYRQRHDDDEAMEISVDDPIDLSGDDQSSVFMHLWLKVEIGTHILWAYAFVAPGQTSGRSTSFVPSHPV